MDAVIIRKMDLPIGIKGITVLDENGDYNIYLNDRLSYDQQSVAFRHEIEHIKQGHFYSYEDLLTLEKHAEYG